MQWANFGRWGGTGTPGVPQSMGSQRVRHDWETELTMTLERIVRNKISTPREIVAVLSFYIGQG